MIIRNYNNLDKEQLIAIFRLNVPKYFAPNELHDFIQYLSLHSATYLVVELDGKIIGGAGYYVKPSDSSGRICWIFFHPDHTGRGAGKLIVEHCINQLRALSGVKKLVVMTSQHAFKFFEKFGYKVIRTKKDYWGIGLDLYLMGKPFVETSNDEH